MQFNMAVTFIALPLVSMGSNNAVSDAITVMMMNKMIVTVVLVVTNVCKRYEIQTKQRHNDVL